MAISFVHVRPGDLITSDFINMLLDEVQSLDTRVSNLETGGSTASGPPILTSRSPTDDVAVFSGLTLIGQNFVLPVEQNTVALGGISINQFIPVSNDKQLTFQVPNLFTNLPLDTTVYVSNQHGASNPLPIRLLPAGQNQAGKVVIFDQTATLGQIQLGQTYPLKWLVDSQTNQPATYNLTVVFTNINGASLAAWQTGTQISPSGPQQIAMGHPLTVTANVTVPSGATSVDVALSAVSADALFAGTSDVLSLTIGQAPPVSDPRALLTLGKIPPYDQNGQPNPVHAATINGQDGIQLKFNTTGTIPINMHVTPDQTAAGRYSYSASIEQPGGVWSLPTNGIVPSQSGQLAPSDTQISVQLQNSDASQSTTVTFMVVKASHIPTGATTPDFVSFVRFPIQGSPS